MKLIINTIARYQYILIINIFLLFTTTNAQWVKAFVEGGHTKVHCLFSHNTRLFACSDNGIYASTDDGATWIATEKDDAPAYAIVRSGNNLFAGFNGVVVSTDNGINWNKTGGAPPPYALAVRDSNIFAGSPYGGLFLSTDNGANWDTITDRLPTRLIGALAVMGNNVIIGTIGCSGRYCVGGPGYGGIFFSSDNGVTWGTTSIINIDVNVFAVNDSILFAGTSVGVFQSVDKALHWSLTGLSKNTYALAAQGTMLLAGTDVGIFVSTDNGVSWHMKNAGLPNAQYSQNPRVTAVAIQNTNLFAAIDGIGVFISRDNGESWSPATAGLSNIEPTAFIRIGENIYCGTYGDGIFRSSDAGSTWYPVNNPSDSHITSFAISGSHLIAGSNSDLFLSEDTCKSWKTSYGGPWISGQTGARALGAVSNDLYAGFCYQLFISTDGGVNWIRSLDGGGIGQSDWVTSFALNGANIFVGTWSGLFRTTNNGISWDTINNGAPNNGTDFYNPTLLDYNLTALIANDDILFVGNGGRGIYVSTNNGSSWIERNNGLSDFSVSSLAASGTNVFVGTQYGGGVFISTNNGTNWNSVNTGLTNINIQTLFVNGTTLLVGTNQINSERSGIWRRSISEMTSVKMIHSNLLKYFSLSQNYPNPFNPSTIISFYLPSKSFVTLKVFDIIGRRVATLVNRELAAGNYSQQWNAANLPSGVYFYRLECGSFKETKKLVLLR